MRICIVCPDFYPPLYGNSRIAWEYSKRISDSCKVCAITNGKKYSIITVNGIEITSIPFSNKKQILKNLNLIKKSILSFKPDIIHGFGLYSSILTFFCKICGNVKTVQTVSGIWPVFTLKNQKINLLKTIKIIPLLFIDGIIFTNNYTKNYFIDSNLFSTHKKPLSIIHYGVEDIWYHFNPPNFKKNIVFFGDGTKERGLLTVLSSIEIVIKKIPDVRYVIAIRHWNKKLKNQAHYYFKKYKNNIELIEHPIDAHISKIVKQADIVVLPFNVNSMEPPISLIESLISGKTVITTDIGGNSDIFSCDENMILIKPGDFEELAEKICELLDNFEVIKKISSKAHNASNNQFSWPECVKNSIKFYKYLS